MTRKIILSIGTVLFTGIIILCVYYYQQIFSEIVKKDGVIYIHTNDNIGDVKKELIEFIGDKNLFNWLADKKKYKNPKPGKYRISRGMSLNDVINLLRSGNQTPVKLTFNNQNSLEEFSSRISQQIELDSLTILNAFKDSLFLQNQKLSKVSSLGILIPNTYEVFWNISKEQLRNRMLKEYRKFWNNDRMQKAKKLKMSPSEVMTLASIVQKETSKSIERPIVAGLYINRLVRGIPLQADPTIMYILKQQNKGFRKRVLFKDLKIKSPYNTYLNKGLPPSVIAMPDISSIEAVLNYRKHNYLYMCASSEKLGFHIFTNSLRQHNKNAMKYQKWLNKQGINR
ncbi:MAG: Endolytic murein transglycosylase [Flavobacterium sp. SCGC AAA160-P02]|nr:MAG: Endolytic murein transglycosylase [Flavobacterium sp. SCGC AAA160-P02]